MRYPLPYAFAREHLWLLEDDGHGAGLVLLGSSSPAATDEAQTRRQRGGHAPGAVAGFYRMGVAAVLLAVPFGRGIARDGRPARRETLIAILAGLFFLLRYLRKIRDHHLELEPGKLRFVTGGECSELDLAQVAAIRLFKRWGKLQHIQLLLKNNRGIRLEGYQDLPHLAERLQAELPAGKLLR